MSPEQAIATVIAVLISNALQSFVTVQAIKVHIEYLKEGLASAHKRIEALEARK